MKWADLSPGLRAAVGKYVDGVRTGDGANPGPTLRTDRIEMGEELSASLLIPEIDGGIAVSVNELNYAGVGNQYLEELAYDPSAAPTVKPTAPANAPAGSVGFPPALRRRVLIGSPADGAEAAALVRAAARHGMTDVWLEVGLADPDASARLLTRAG